jgi:WD40 repeat protein
VRSPSSLVKPVNSWSFDAGDHVASLCWLPGSARLAVAPAEGRVAVLDRATGAARLTLSGHPGSNRRVAASSALPLLATAGHDGAVRLWSTDTGELVSELGIDGSAWVEELAWSPDGRLLAATAGRTLRIWDAAGALVFQCSAHDSTIAALAWRPDGRGIATGCYNGVRLFRIEEEQPYERLAWKGSIISLA